MPVRAVDPLFIQPDGSGIYVSSPLVEERLKVEPEIVAVLLGARRSLADDQDPAAFGLAGSDYAAVLAELLRLGFLVKDGGPETGAREAPWDAWGDVAWWFHQRTRNAPYLVPESDPEKALPQKEELATRPRPATFLASLSDQPVLLLPRIRQPFTLDYQQVLENRRTHREFAAEPIPLDSFATLLHYSFAPLRFSDAGMMGVVHLRAGASAGARHETEAYVAVFDVEDVAPGLYRYDNLRHGLVPVDAEAGRETLEELTYGQGFCRASGFAVVTVAVADRMSWKYRHPRTYRAVMQDVGHAAQVFSMTATALGLGASLTGAFRDDEVDRLLGLNGPAEFATFVMACGIPQRRPDGLPLDHTAPSTAWNV